MSEGYEVTSELPGRPAMCMLISACFCACVNACIVTQLGGLFLSHVGDKEFGGLSFFTSLIHGMVSPFIVVCCFIVWVPMLVLCSANIYTLYTSTKYLEKFLQQQYLAPVFDTSI